MRNVSTESAPVVDIWPYVDGLDLDDLKIPSINDVHYVYRDAHDEYDQILIGTGRFNTMLVIVVDRRREAILGHHLLDLSQEYGTGGGHLKSL